MSDSAAKWLPSESKYLSTSGQLVSPAVLLDSPSGVGRSPQTNGRGGTVFVFLPPCSSCGTSLALYSHSHPKISRDYAE